MLHQHLARLAQSPLAAYAAEPPWQLTSASDQIVRFLLDDLRTGEFTLVDQDPVNGADAASRR